MSEVKLTGEDLAEARIWRLSQARNQMVSAEKALLDLIELWPEEAKRLDMDMPRSLWNRIVEGTRADK